MARESSDLFLSNVQDPISRENARRLRLVLRNLPSSTTPSTPVTPSSSFVQAHASFQTFPLDLLAYQWQVVSTAAGVVSFNVLDINNEDITQGLDVRFTGTIDVRSNCALSGLTARIGII